jgi:hypothetical protein
MELKNKPTDILQTMRLTSPEIDGLLYLAEPITEGDLLDPRKNPFQVIKIGREIQKKLASTFEDYLPFALQTFDLLMMDPFRLMKPESLTKDEIDAHTSAIINNDTVLYSLQRSLVDPEDQLEKLLAGKRPELIEPEHLFTKGEPPIPDEVKMDNMRRLAAGILLFAGMEIARITPPEKIPQAIDALTIPLTKALNAAFLVRPPGNYPLVIIGARAIMEYGTRVGPNQP